LGEAAVFSLGLLRQATVDMAGDVANSNAVMRFAAMCMHHGPAAPRAFGRRRKRVLTKNGERLLFL
jgi:hypothetical protein